MSNEKAQAYWNANEHALKGVGRFEMPKGVTYKVVRDLIAEGALIGAVKDETVDFNTEVLLPPHKISDNRASVEVRVSFDAAEGDGRVWLMDPQDNWVAIEGESNARELARLLLAWADTYPAKEPAQ